MDRLGDVREFVGYVYEKAGEDNIFFLASGMTFSLLLAALPFLLLLLSVAGLVLTPQFEAPQGVVLGRLWELLPVGSASVQGYLAGQLQDILSSAGSVGLVSAVLFVWFSTRLFGAVRTVLAEVFDLGEPPGVIRGKWLDVQLVLVSTVLLTLNVAITTVLSGLGQQLLELAGLQAGPTTRLAAFATAFLFIYVMFLLIFKFVSLNRIRWRTAALAALFASVSFELLKVGFGWYVSNFADYSSIFFAFSVLVVVVLAIYYGSILFILGGEVAQVYELRRTLREQRQIFHRT
ncbi:MAG: YihY/virulence factor BrkB family protein [Candidatus Palauibacterales bacterium]|nr:YihY/virulence factor BrkB family protein [Candidatus Palauibacterales bacterium]MDP2528145.1 YihY/virulence factor BrkB family protein [Candidatus Palauibacterales bacterium]MDP2584237.1 YihY/virulence factor BrkB family protein [Candidatus Palauibacterales bacterium]